MTEVRGIHHVSTIASDPQRNIDFFAGLLGLRLVKRTVNFDDPETYHLYYGDEVGTPGCIMTFFPWPGAKPGRQGPGECAVVSFSVLPGAIGFWLERFVRHGVTHERPVSRGTGDDAERVLAFRDHDGALYELVGHEAAAARPAWTQAPGIPAEHVIHGFHSVTLWVEDAEPKPRKLFRQRHLVHEEPLGTAASAQDHRAATGRREGAGAQSLTELQVARALRRVLSKVVGYPQRLEDATLDGLGVEPERLANGRLVTVVFLPGAAVGHQAELTPQQLGGQVIREPVGEEA